MLKTILAIVYCTLADAQAANVSDAMAQLNELFYSFADFGTLGPTLVPYNVTLRNTQFIFSTINRLPAANSLTWPDDEIKRTAGVDAWGEWRPKVNMTADVIWGWGTGQKWLLHFKEENKYLVVRDRCVSSSFRIGKQRWFDHHVHKNDPRHIDVVRRQEARAKEAAAREASGETALFPPLMISLLMVFLIGLVLCLGVTTHRNIMKDREEFKKMMALKQKEQEGAQQKAGESTEESQKKTEDRIKDQEKKKTETSFD